jgi:hypothetical protein
MADELPELPKKPSFISSVASGIGGFIKGALSGGVMGALGGAAIAAIAVGVAAIAGVPILAATATAAAAAGTTTATVAGFSSVAALLGIEATALTAGAVVGSAALTGAAVGGAALATVGAGAGTLTGVIKSREEGQPKAEDIVNVAKISFAQGVAVGHNIEHSAQVQHGHAATKHADKVTTERAAMAMAERQVIQ